MIFKRIIGYLWQLSDVLLFISAMVVLDYTAFKINATLGWFVISLILFVLGWLVEAISERKRGGS
ncbi:DUF1056 family protein [Ligilactobacillus salivarius]|uniref:DUF1056 family protein n=1 Tax=Ligilactobacillus salivarius TaxID=1624 RepID=A0ABD6JBL9_9LACO|nr:DUF1056 family protein [Ligilactobacillus salivarius]MYU49810.1 DUF1056 family protein [Ligilactobacillus salivarius]MYU95024.1 DUF1056 family protein [Ligilactobacillus salivarius]MYV15165.1 DUF1056 family protein [Ligilactobacillus salivarius]MYV25279.1 DUF1056 family protein [Ligilactobacillus salivarius]MYY38886.1 DUF1056 family protein [Ligilactobacillus salivarius]